MSDKEFIKNIKEDPNRFKDIGIYGYVSFHKIYLTIDGDKSSISDCIKVINRRNNLNKLIS